MEITKETLLEKFDYDKEKGLLIWKNPPLSRPKLKGNAAGCLMNKGYLKVNLSGKTHLVHRLIFIIEFGYSPYEIDHLNGNKTDNRVSNLRNVSDRQNACNRGRHRKGKLVGASVEKSRHKWRAQIEVEKKKIHLGYFGTEEQANAAYLSYVKDNNLC